MPSEKKVRTIHQRPVELLQKLIQFDTTNPPGNEAECISFIEGLLREAKIETKILAKSRERPNLLARLKGKGNSPPLLLYGHVDVVTTKNQSWKHPPFSGDEAEGYVWGRGALDMKGGVAMMLSSLLRAKSEELDLPGDVILAVLSDEEAGSDFGAKYLVENHPEEFDGAQYAIGEFGGATLHVGKRRLYPIAIAEKQMCWIKATLRGKGGHGSMPVRGEAMAKLARLLQRLDKKRLPVHVTPAAKLMFGGMARAAGGFNRGITSLLLVPILTNRILGLVGDRGRILDPLLHNSISPTVLQGSDKINVIPGAVSVEIDGRLLPGFNPEDMIEEVRRIAGRDVDLELIRHDPGPSKPDMGLFDILSTVVKEEDPEGFPVPLMLSGVTDARFFSRLGIQTYGFTPMKLPVGFNFADTIHAADERIPVEGLEFGTRAILKAIERFGDSVKV